MVVSISKKLLSIGGICFLVTLVVVAITWGSALATQNRVSTYAQTAAVSREFSAMSQQFQEVRQAGFSAALGVANDDKYHQATQDFTTQLKIAGGLAGFSAAGNCFPHPGFGRPDSR